MLIARWRFKLALKQCKANEDKLRAEAIASQLKDKKVVSFWRDVQMIKCTRNKLPNRIDEALNEKDVADLWKKQIFYCSE